MKIPFNLNHILSGYAKLFVSLRSRSVSEGDTTAKQSQHLALDAAKLFTEGAAYAKRVRRTYTSFHVVTLAMTNVQLILPKYLYSLILLGSLSAGLTSIKPSLAQSNIAPDNTLGADKSQIVPNVNNKNGIPSILIEGGAERGKNLFHSFEEFNISEGRGAYFLVPNDAIENVLTRVTGNNPSTINGILGTIFNGNFDPTSANLFLINPNGIIFGKNSSLDVGSSFVGTTANTIEFGSQGFFSATNPQGASELLTISPTAFLFNQINSRASITNNSVVQSGVNTSGDSKLRGLRVADGENLLLVGGNVNMDGGGLHALGGVVSLGGLAAKGRVGLNHDGNNLSLSFPQGVQRSDVSLSNGAGVNVRASDGGAIAVNARNLSMTQGSFLYAGIDEGSGSEQSRAGNIDVNATVAIKLDDSDITNQVQAEARGEGGNVNIGTSTLVLEGGAVLGAATSGKGKGGNLRVDALNVQVIGRSKDGQFPSALFVSAQPNSSGDVGDLTINADTLHIKDGALVDSSTFGAGKGGSLTINAKNVQVIGRSQNRQLPTGLLSQALPNSSGDAGDLTINANTLRIVDGAQVSASTFGAGNGGDLTIDAKNVKVIGEVKDGSRPSLLIATSEITSKGNAGDLTINTNNLHVSNGGQVNTGTTGMGDGGDLTIDAKNVQLIGGGKDVQLPVLLSSSTLSSSTGDAGDLTINTDTLLVKDGAQVSAATFGAGNGGKLNIDAKNVQVIGTSSNPWLISGVFRVRINVNIAILRDRAQVNSGIFDAAKRVEFSFDLVDIQVSDISEDGQFPSLLATSTQPNSTGNANNLTINTNSLLLKDGARVSSSTSGKGNGGDLTIDAQTLQLKDDSKITALSRGSGSAGNISIKVKNNFLADNGQVITQAEQSSGGDIEITAKNIFLRNNSDIKTILSKTTGSGGDITLSANAIVALEDSDILAFAPEGSGGNINFNTRAFLSDPLYSPTTQTTDAETLNKLDGNNRVDVNASGRTQPGTVSVDDNSSFLQDSLTELAQNLIDSQALIASSCVVRSKEQNGTFFITGSGGFPYYPGEVLASVYSAVEVEPVTDDSSVSKARGGWKIGDPIVEPTGVYRLANGRRILSRECDS